MLIIITFFRKKNLYWNICKWIPNYTDKWSYEVQLNTFNTGKHNQQVRQTKPQCLYVVISASKVITYIIHIANILH
jgi:hypothetical protein